MTMQLPEEPEELALSVIKSAEGFPIDFDDAWQELSYSTKSNARRLLVNRFVEGTDYLVERNKVQPCKHGRPNQKIVLTRNCFEQLKTMKPKAPVRAEATLRDALAKKVNAQTEVMTPAGRIDILTSTELIEIKEVSAWKSGLGQVLVYRHYYPSHQPRVHLYGAAHHQFKQMVEENATKLGVAVTWEG